MISHHLISIWMWSHCLFRFLFYFLTQPLLFILLYNVVCLREVIGCEMHDRHLIVSVFLLGGVGLMVLNWLEDKRHTPVVAALSFRRSLWGWPHHTARGDNLYSPPFLCTSSFYSLSLSLTVIFSSFSSLTISVPTPSPRSLPSFRFPPFYLRLSCKRTLAVSKAPHKGTFCTPSPWHLKE